MDNLVYNGSSDPPTPDPDTDDESGDDEDPSLTFTQSSGQSNWLMDAAETKSVPSYPVKGANILFTIQGVWVASADLEAAQFAVALNGD